MISSRPINEKGNGVIILAKNGFKMIPILIQLHTENLCAAILHKQNPNEFDGICKLMAIAVYVKHVKR